VEENLGICVGHDFLYRELRREGKMKIKGASEFGSVKTSHSQPPAALPFIYW
jgi:hypothetical protein